ncbi:MAG: hypothetical protein ACLUNV_05285 [Sutterella wadsworthensis]
MPRAAGTSFEMAIASCSPG